MCVCVNVCGRTGLFERKSSKKKKRRKEKIFCAHACEHIWQFEYAGE